MSEPTIKEKIREIKGKRTFLVELLERPNLGILRIDVNQDFPRRKIRNLT